MVIRLRHNTRPETTKRDVVSIRECRTYVRSKTPFITNNKTIDSRYYPEKDQYVVWSFDEWPLFLYDYKAQHWFGNESLDTRVSNSMNNFYKGHMRQANPLDGELKWLPSDRMNYLFINGYNNLLGLHLGAFR